MRLIWLAFVILTSCLVTVRAVLADESPSDQFANPPYGATSAEVQAALKDCAGTQINMNICNWSRYNETENALKSATSRLSELLQNDVERQSFASANHAFKQFRDATCAFDLTAIEGGSMGFSVVYRCRGVYNNHRIRSLKRYADCLTLEVSCSAPFFFFVYDTSSEYP